MSTQDDSKFNISINFNWDRNQIKGRKVDPNDNAQVYIKPRDIRPSEYQQMNLDENDILMSNKILSNKSSKAKKKKKTKKSKKSITSQKVKGDSKQNTKQNITQKPIKQKKCQTQSQQQSNFIIPWGLNQERLKNYFIQEKIKFQHAQEVQQRRTIKTEQNKKQRRDQLGISFLNNLPESSIKNKIKKSKTVKEGQSKIIGNQKKNINNEEIKQYQAYKFRMMELAKQEKMKLEWEKQLKIHQNLQNLKDYIQSRNRSFSCETTKHSKKKRAMSQHTYQNEIIYEDSKENQISDRMVQQKKRKVLLQFKDNQDKFKLQVPPSQHESMRQPCSSIYQFMSNSSANESDPEDDLGNLDDSFYSKKIKLITLQDDKEELMSSQRDWDEQDLKEIEDIRSIEKAASKFSEKRQKSEADEQAAIKIQKVWRGFKTRQILKYYQDYFEKEQEEGVVDDNGFDLNQLTQSQIEELVKMGYLDFNSQGELNIVDQQSGEEQSSHSLHRVQEPQQREITSEAEGAKHIFEAEAYQDYIEGFSESVKSDLKRRKQSSPIQDNDDEEEEEQNYQFKKKKRLSINVEEIEKEYQKQQAVEIGEMRSAIGSESIIKSLKDEDQPSFVQNGEKSVFEQNSFQEFVSTKFKELLQRDKMDELIKMREQILEERHKQQAKTIKEAYQNNQISPRTFDVQQKKLEKWVTKQRKDLEQKKQEIQKGQQSTYETFLKTQRDIMFMKQISQSNSQSYIKVIDSFSQESIIYSEASLKNSIIDIQNQNQNINTLDDDLTKSNYFDDNLNFENSSVSEPEPPQPLNFQKFSQSQVLRVSDIMKDQQPMSDKQADSYAIVISNMIIAEEIKNLNLELRSNNIDLIEMMNRVQFRDVSVSQLNQPKGFKTNLQQVKQYVQFLGQFLYKNQIEGSLSRMNTPFGPTSNQMLKFLRSYECSLCEDEEETEEFYAKTQILTSEQFGEIEKELLNQGIVKQRDNKDIMDLEHIHNKVIFDAFNMALDHYRPFGINGQPFKWKHDPQRLIYRKRTIEEMPGIIQKCQEKVIEWSQCLVGIMMDKEDNPYPKILMFDQECLAQIKEDRMIRMLSLEVLDQEDRWLDYEEELAEVKVQLSQEIFDQLIEDFVKEINQ